MTIKLPQHCYVVTTKQPKSLYALHTSTSTRLICFKDIAQAERCEYSLAKYRNKYGKWPRRLMQGNKFDDIEILEKEKTTLAQCAELLEIQYAETESIIDMCNFFSIGLIMCQTFEVVDGKLLIRGVQIHETKLEVDEQRKILENILES